MTNILESAATGAWIFLLVRALGDLDFSSVKRNVTLVALTAGASCILALLTTLISSELNTVHELCLVVANVAGLVLIEQLARNSVPDFQWRIRYMNIGLGLFFSFHLILHALTVALGMQLDTLLAIQPAVLGLVPIFLSVASLRNRTNTLRLNLSREFVFRTGVLAMTGALLLALSLLGYLAELMAGDIGLTLTLFTAIVCVGLFVTLITSAKFRARIRVNLSKTFFAYRYDYRDEWLKLTAFLTEYNADFNLLQQAQRALLSLLQADHACLWLVEEAHRLRPASNINAPAWQIELDEATTQAVFTFFEQRDWVLDLHDMPPEAGTLGTVFSANPSFQSVRFLVPLMVNGKLFGIVVIGDSAPLASLSWEDYEVDPIDRTEIGPC